MKALLILLVACGVEPKAPMGIVIRAEAMGNAEEIAEISRDLNAARGCEWVSPAGEYPVDVVESPTKLTSIPALGLTARYTTPEVRAEMELHPRTGLRWGDLWRVT